MLDARAGAHDLNVACLGPPGVAQAVLVGDGALGHVGDDLHIGVRMRPKACAARDLVVVPHPQPTPMHAGVSVVIREREVMLGLQPAMMAAAESAEGSQFNHNGLPFPDGLDR